MKGVGFVPLYLLVAIQLPGSREVDLSFHNNSLMESFWKHYEKVRSKGDWQHVVAVSLTAPDIKKVTIPFRNNTVPYELIEDWLRWETTILPRGDKSYRWLGN